jgi:hypothetical protein
MRAGTEAISPSLDRASVMPALGAGIHVFWTKTWMAGTSPAMTGRYKRKVAQNDTQAGRTIITTDCCLKRCL